MSPIFAFIQRYERFGTPLLYAFRHFLEDDAKNLSSLFPGVTAILHLAIARARARALLRVRAGILAGMVPA